MTVPYYVSEDKSDKARLVRDGGRRRPLLRAFFQSRGMPQQNHSADERDDGVQVATRDELKHISGDIRR
jgi:hypothetical protein